MDLSTTIIPKSDQLNAEDLLTGPVTVTVEKVSKGSVEQPVNIHLVEYPRRPFRPSKSMRRVLVNAWGKDASKYAGRSMTLFRDPSIKFGGEAVGGIRISHLSHIDKPRTLAITVTRGKRAEYTVKPLQTSAPQTDAPLDLSPMWSALKIAGITEPGEMLATVKDIVGRDIGSSKDLTAEDMTAVMDNLAARMAGDHDG